MRRKLTSDQNHLSNVMPYKFCLCLLLFIAPGSLYAQSLSANGGGTSPLLNGPQELEILGISVEGVDTESMTNFVLRSSGLAVGQMITLPADQAIAEAIRSLYKLRVFSDVKIIDERRAGTGVFLRIQVQEEPQLVDYTFTGVKRRHRKDLEEKVPLFKGSRLRAGDLERTTQIIKDYFSEKGHMLAEVTVTRETSETDNSVSVNFDVDIGAKVRIKEVNVRGSEQVSARKVRGRLKKTKAYKPLFFWRKSRYDRSLYQEDKTNVLAYYHARGYYDARIERDSVYLDTTGKRPGLVIDLDVVEGPQYHIRNVTWEGNTVYSDENLANALGVEPGDVYNGERLEQNLYGNRQSSDISSLYMNRGYMLFRVEPEVRVVEGDSLDLYYDLYEGDIFEFGEIDVKGNSKTKEHVIRRELYTIPGQTFSRELIQETIRRLSQLTYFDQDKLGAGPSIDLDNEAKQVNLTYNLEEVGSDQLELSGSYHRYGLILMLRFAFNNFAAGDLFERKAWRPLPAGDGQRLSVALQTSGRAYQSYQLSFTEPWFRGRPTPVGFNLSHSRFSGYGYGYSLYGYTQPTNSQEYFIRTSGSVFYEQRLQWPDDKFSTSTSLGYQHFVNRNFTSVLPQGASEQVTIRQALSRSSVDHPVFPTVGSTFLLSTTLALPIGSLVQYHKWRLNSSWNVPIMNKLTLNMGGEFGYIGSLTGGEVLFERYIVGGSPFDYQGAFNNYGKDIVFMRGYPERVLGPRRNDEPIGGRILNKFTSEIRLLAVQTPQLTAAPYIFMDAANTWDNFSTYNPAQLYRSAGLGARLFLPILGMLEITYGYNFDPFVPYSGLSGKHDGSSRWLFQFTLGQGFGN